MGRQAATMLFQAIEQDEPLVLCTVEIPVKFVTRESTGPPPQIKWKQKSLGHPGEASSSLLTWRKRCDMMLLTLLTHSMADAIWPAHQEKGPRA